MCEERSRDLWIYRTSDCIYELFGRFRRYFELVFEHAVVNNFIYSTHVVVKCNCVLRLEQLRNFISKVLISVVCNNGVHDKYFADRVEIEWNHL